MRWGCFVWTLTPSSSRRRTPHPGPARVCLSVLFSAGLSRPASRSFFDAPHRSSGCFVLLLCSAPPPAGVALACFLLFSLAPPLLAPPLSPAFCGLWSGVPLALVLCGFFSPPQKPTLFFFLFLFLFLPCVPCAPIVSGSGVLLFPNSSGLSLCAVQFHSAPSPHPDFCFPPPPPTAVCFVPCVVCCCSVLCCVSCCGNMLPLPALFLFWAAPCLAGFFRVAFCVLCCAQPFCWLGLCVPLCLWLVCPAAFFRLWLAVLPWSCRLLCCVPGCCAATCCFMWCCAVVPWGVVPSTAVSCCACLRLCSARDVLNCGVLIRAVVRRCALCCVCPGWSCCVSPVLTALCGAVLRGAGLVSCCSFDLCCFWHLGSWSVAVCYAVCFRVLRSGVALPCWVLGVLCCCVLCCPLLQPVVLCCGASCALLCGAVLVRLRRSPVLCSVASLAPGGVLWCCL